MKIIIHFLSNYFEIILAANLVLVILYLVTKIIVNIQVNKGFDGAVNQTFRWMVVIGQVILFYIYGYIVWINYKEPIAVLNFPQDVIFNTRWVRDPIKIYYVEDNKLNSIRITGQDSQNIFEAPSVIREYQFSPDGNDLLIVTAEELYLLNLKTKAAALIDKLQETKADIQVLPLEVGKDHNIKGVITGVRWSPDSQKFCYEISRWSQYSSIDQLYVYDLASKTARTIPSPTRRVSSLYWDQDSQHLYYLRNKTFDKSESPYPYELDVYRITWDQLRPVYQVSPNVPQPQFIARIPSYEKAIPLPHLKLRNVDLDFQGDRLSFGKVGVQKPSWTLENGPSIGIDKEDYLYFTRGKWFRKRIFKIPRETDFKNLSKYQYQGGPLRIHEMYWLPGGRYVIMVDKYLGDLILDPFEGKVGKLIGAGVKTLGWYR